MADGGHSVRRRRLAPERNEYKQTLMQLVNFVDNELGNGRAPRPKPDIGEWKKQRAKTIRILNELREKLDTVCVRANYGKTIGNGAEIVGVVVAIIGALMSLFGKSSSPEVMNTGKLVQQTGTCIAGFSDVIESYISEKYLKEIVAVLEVDQALSRPLVEWLNFSNQLDVHAQAIFGVSLTSGAFNIIIKIFQDITKLSKSVRDFNGILSLLEQERYSIYIGNEVKFEKFEKFYQCLSASPRFAERIRRILSVLGAPTGSIQFCMDGVRTYNSIMDIVNPSVVPTLQAGDNPEFPTTAEVSVFCVFQAINLASSVLSVINTANIIKNGTSQYSEALKKLTSSLSWELQRMENL